MDCSPPGSSVHGILQARILECRTLNLGWLAQLCFWHFVGQRALEHLLGWEREGYANCTLVAAEAAKKGGGHLTAL